MTTPYSEVVPNPQPPPPPLILIRVARILEVLDAPGFGQGKVAWMRPIT